MTVDTRMSTQERGSLHLIDVGIDGSSTFPEWHVFSLSDGQQTRYLPKSPKSSLMESSFMVSSVGGKFMLLMKLLLLPRLVMQ